MALFLSTFWSNSAEAKSTEIKSEFSINPVSKNILYTDENELKKDSNKVVIKGKVFDKETNEPIPFATVFIKDIGFGMTTDIDGNFLLSIPDSISKQPFILIINCIGYSIIEKTIDCNIESKNFNYYLLEDIQLKSSGSIITGEIIEVNTCSKMVKKKKWWKRKQKD